MSKLKFAGAALIFILAIPFAACAQEAVQEPGMESFYHPNADVLNAGTYYGNPYAASAYAPYEANAAMAAQDPEPYRRSGAPKRHASRAVPY
jgi:hypothetical protein